MSKYANWYQLISYALEQNSESWNDVISNTLTEEEMYEIFNRGYGNINGIPFTVWTNDYVYFPRNL